jgi:ribonuclease HI
MTKTVMKTATAYIDGSGNSSRIQASAVVLYLGERQYTRTAILDPHTTNNVGEYTGALLAVRLAKDLGVQDLRIFSDSKVLVNQLNGQWKTRSDHLVKLRDQIWDEAQDFHAISIEWIPREENEIADLLCRTTAEEARKRNKSPA